MHDRKKKLALAFVESKRMLGESPASETTKSRLDDIMLASIRTLSFIWDTNCDKSLDVLVDQIIRYMAQVVAMDLEEDENVIYIDILRKIS